MHPLHLKKWLMWLKVFALNISGCYFPHQVFISSSEFVPLLSSLWSDIQKEEQAGAKQMILWEQWTLFCAPHNKFPPPPVPQKKESFTVKKQGGGHCSTGAFISLWWIFFFLLHSVLCLGFMRLSGGSTVSKWWIMWGGKSEKRATASLLLSAVYKPPLLQQMTQL